MLHFLSIVTNLSCLFQEVQSKLYEEQFLTLAAPHTICPARGHLEDTATLALVRLIVQDEHDLP